LKKRLNSIVTFVENKLILLGALSIFLMMILVTIDVCGRFFFNSPLVGQKEITEMLMVGSVYFAIGYTQREKGHVGMDLIITKILKGNTKKVVLILTLFLSAAISIIVSYYTFLYALESYEKGMVSIYLGWPVWSLPLMVSIGSLLLTVRLLIDLIESFEGNYKLSADDVISISEEDPPIKL
jgi:TRAP-type C4-dicarboxylate transport system permease small subunit